jgi:hypothetical protein
MLRHPPGIPPPSASPSQLGESAPHARRGASPASKARSEAGESAPEALRVEAPVPETQGWAGGLAPRARRTVLLKRRRDDGMLALLALALVKLLAHLVTAGRTGSTGTSCATLPRGGTRASAMSTIRRSPRWWRGCRHWSSDTRSWGCGSGRPSRAPWSWSSAG